MSNLLLNLDDFVRVTQETGEEVLGRYDGTDYTFPHGEPVDVHKAVAVHIFGFGLPEESTDPHVQDKTAALLRLNWVSSSGDKKAGLAKLRSFVRFEEIPPFPTVLKFKQAEENTGMLQQDLPESASRVPSSPPLGGGGLQATAAPTDPARGIAAHTKTLGLPKAGKG
jgi:hypothetical protein